MFGFFKNLLSAFSPPKPCGPPKLIQKLAPGTKLISSKSTWEGTRLLVKASAPGTVRILEIPLAKVDQCLLGLKFLMSSTEVEKGAYPEIWVKVEGFGEAFSKGLNFRAKGTNSEMTCELPFYLKKDQTGTNLKFNVVFEGAGQIALNNIELYSTPLE